MMKLFGFIIVTFAAFIAFVGCQSDSTTDALFTPSVIVPIEETTTMQVEEVTSADWLIGDWKHEIDKNSVFGSKWRFVEPNRFSIISGGRAVVTGTWTVDIENKVTVEWVEQSVNGSPARQIDRLTLHGNSLLVSEANMWGENDSILLLRRAGATTSSNDTQYLQDSARLIDAEDVSEISISYRWDGEMIYAPLIATFELARVNNEWHGKITHTVVGTNDDYKGEPIKSVRNIILLDSEVRDSLRLFLDASLERGSYRAYRVETDNYPSYNIMLSSSDGRLLRFSSESQGDRAVPWLVRMEADLYSSFSDSIMAGFTSLASTLSLDSDDWDTLFQQFDTAYEAQFEN